MHINVKKFCRGQALVFCLFFLAAAALVAMLLFNNGLLANQKTQLQNAADAGAYSAAIIQARDHNFSAYTNRAMVANQISVAQLVSLKSYFEDAAATHDRMDGWWLSFWADFFPTSKPAWDFAKKIPIESTYDKINSIAPKMVKGIDKLIVALSKAQDLYHTEAIVAIPLIAQDVVKKNDKNAKLSTGIFNGSMLLKQVKSWSEYTKKHRANDSSDEANRFAEVVIDDKTTDSFMQNRLSFPTAMWASTVKSSTCPGATASFTEFTFTHMGGTRLSSDKKGWLALDATTGFGGFVCYWYPSGASGFTINDLGGSGGGLAGEGAYTDGVFGGQGVHYGGARYLIFGGVRRYNSGPGETMDSAGGLQDYYRDVADVKTKPNDQSREENGGKYRIAIEVEHAASAIRTTEKILPNNDSLKLKDGLKGGTMRTIAAGHTYFYRPKTDSSQFTRSGWHRKDGKTELANLFNPYWQASLVEVSNNELAISLAAQ